MVYDLDKIDLESKWMKDLKKYVRKHKWTKEEAIKYLHLTAKALETEITEVLAADDDDDFLAKFDREDNEEIITDDDILSETIILSQDGEGHN